MGWLLPGVQPRAALPCLLRPEGASTADPACRGQRAADRETGVAGGIGKATAKIFHNSGWQVVGIDRKPVDNLPKEMTIINADISDPESVKGIFNSISGKVKGLDALINNAAVQICKPLVHTTTDEWDTIMTSNLRSVYLAVRMAYPLMKNRESAIINISSVAGFIPIPFQSMYSASKAALESMSEALRMEVKHFGIKVALICPGDMKTNFHRVYAKKNKGSVYEKKCNNAVDVMIKDEMNGSDPIVVVKELKKVLNKANPSIRKIVGLDYKVIGVLKRLLPSKLVEFIVVKIYIGRK